MLRTVRMLPSLPRSNRSAVALVSRRKLLPIVGLLLAAVLGFTAAGRASSGAHAGARTARGRTHFNPTVTLSPASGTHFSSNALEITVGMCDDTYGIASARYRTTGDWEFVSDGLGASCGFQPGNDGGVIDLTLTPGENDITVESCNYNGDCGYGSASYFLDTAAMFVEANYHSITYPLPSDTTSFDVINTAQIADTVDWSVSCTAGATCSGTTSGKYFLAVDSSHVTTVTVSRSSAGSGKVTFSAHYNTYTSIGGSDTTHVTATIPPPTVTAPSSPQSESPGGNVTLAFPLSVGAYSAGTYTLTPSCGDFTNCSVSPSSFTMSASTTDTAHVTFHVPYFTANQDIAVKLKASGPGTDSASTTVDVGAVPVSSVFVGFDAPRVDIGQNTTAHATIIYADGSTLPNATATWSSGNTGIATVNSSTGSVSGAGAGSTSITATVSGGSGSASIPVTTPPSVGLEVTMDRLNAEGSVARDACLTIAAGDDAAYECGDLRLVHPLPGVMTMNESRAPMLIYNSRHSVPIALVAANVTGFSISPTSLTATLKIGGDTLTHTYSWNGSCNSATCRIVIPVPADSLSLATGWYADTLQVSVTSGGTPYTATAVGSVAIVNRTTSPFGAGWWLDGLEQLVMPADTTKKFWVAGDGSTRLYVQTGVDSVFTPQTVVDRPDTLMRVGSNWRRHLRNGAYVEFDGSGNHIRTVNRERDTTRFAYSGAALDSIVLPTPSATKPTYTFSYATNGVSLPVLQSVSSPGASGARTTTVSRTGNWQITQIEDPDSTNVYFTWANNLIVRRKNRLGDSTTYTYDGAGGLTQVAIDMSRTGDSAIVRHFCAAEVRSLTGCAGTSTTPVPLSSAITYYDGPRTDSSDVTTFFINRFGAPDTVVDAHGNKTRVHRSLMFPALADSVIDPTSFKQNAIYTARGLLQASTAVAPYGGSNATTSYTYDDIWDQLTSATTSTGLTSYFTYDPTTGNRVSQRSGLADSTQVLFWYNARNQVDSVLAPAHAAQHIAYDPTLGNDSVVTTPGGAHTVIARNAIGAPVTVRMQTDWADTLPTFQHLTYDIMGRLRVDSTVSTSFHYSTTDSTRTVPSLARVMYDTLDAEGMLRSRTRASLPDLFGGGAQFTTFTYDAAHRRRRRVEYLSSHDSTWYDPAGNPIGFRSGRGKTITRTYDALNRLVQRSVPGDSVPKDECQCANDVIGRPAVWVPYWQTILAGGDSSVDLILQPDVDTFTYDAAGRMLAAINHDARVYRSYYANGALHVETDSLRAYDPADTMANRWGQHAYALTYTYDLDGRRTAMSGLVGQSYHYNALGMLDSTTGPDGTHHGLQYDAAGRLTRLATPGSPGVVETRAYDNDDNLVSRVNNTYIDAMAYDARGKIIGLSSEIDVGYLNVAPYGEETGGMAYDGFGGLVMANRSRGAIGNVFRDEYILDALGTLMRSDENEGELDGRSATMYSYSGPQAYTHGADALSALRIGDGTPLIKAIPVTSFAYDSSGNQTYINTYIGQYTTTTGGFDNFDTGPQGGAWQYNFYDGAERLRVSQRTYFLANGAQRTAFQEYFYDALGRRVALRSRRDSACTDDGDMAHDCIQTMERFVWDGDRQLVEMRDAGDWSGLYPYQLNANGGSPNAYFGTVEYTYALGVLGPDEPVMVYKSGSGIQAFVPLHNWRGMYEDGWTADGSTEVGGTTTFNFPSRRAGMYLAPDVRDTTQSYANAWWGSVMQGKVDGIGMVYDRNRYYDPSGGRFTQEDPIGLAGGLNLYGYAGADPVNNSDPFGLCFFGLPCPVAAGGFVSGVAVAGEAIGVGAAAAAAAPYIAATALAIGTYSLVSGPIAPTTDAQVSGALVARDATAVRSVRSTARNALIIGILGIPAAEALDPNIETPTSDHTTTGAAAPDVPKDQTATEKKTKAEQRPPDAKNPN